ncbi:hypothetical protein JKF63_03904 [Porcisia hertigi]|uniref:Transmembrane protein n=1 Tax=Porcisia hertigi TaxID=2761500 RepID=A0A836HRC0_9TRYP|nr:hypothetical protein JKF63_03904 [Porcisia hertigi]
MVYTVPLIQTALPGDREVGDHPLPSVREAVIPESAVAPPIEPYSLQPPPHIQQLPPQEQQHQQQPVMYVPWGVMPPSMQLLVDQVPVHQRDTTATTPPRSPPDPTAGAGAGVVLGTPVISLGLHVPPDPVKRVLIYYAVLLLVLLSAMLLLLGAFFTPRCSAYLNFTRSITDIQDTESYARSIEGNFGKQLTAYARLSPCTVLKQHACDTITADQVSGWMDFITDGMQAPFSHLLSFSDIDQARVNSCSITEESPPAESTETSGAQDLHPMATSGVIGHHTHRVGSDPAQPARLPRRHQEPGSGGNSLDRSPRSPQAPEDRSPLFPPPLSHGEMDAPLHGNSTKHVLIDLYSSVPQEARASLTLTCNGDADAVPMLNLTTILNADVTGYLPNIQTMEGSVVVSAVNLIDGANPQNVLQEYDPHMHTCADYLMKCLNIENVHYVVIAPASPLYRCGQGSIGPPIVGPNTPTTNVDVVVCDTAPLEPMVGTTAALRITVTARFSINMVLYSTNARLPNDPRKAPVYFMPSTVLLACAEALILLSMVFTAVSAGMVPLHRMKLRKLSAKLQADASVAMEIVHRAQGALVAPMPAMPPTVTITTAAAPITHHGPLVEAVHAATDADMPMVSSATTPTTPRRPQEPWALHAAQSALSATAPPMLLAPPYYQAPGMVMPGMSGRDCIGVPGMMMVMPLMMTNEVVRPPSPYGEGYYLDAASTSLLAALPPLEEEPPPETKAPHGGGSREPPTSDTAASGTDVAAQGTNGPQQRGADRVAHPDPSSSSNDSALEPEWLHPADASYSLHSSRASGDEDRHTESGEQGVMAPVRVPATQPLAPAPSVTDWVLAQSRHQVVGPDVAEESMVPSSTAEVPDAASPWWRLRWLHDRVPWRSSAPSAGAAMANNWPGSDSDDELESENSRREGGYAPAGSPPGEHIVQLFVQRSRKSYKNLRRKQVRMLASMRFYAKAASMAALAFVMVTIGLQMSSIGARGSEKLQVRGGDVLTGGRVMDPRQAALMLLSLVLLGVAVLVHFIVECNHT